MTLYADNFASLIDEVSNFDVRNMTEKLRDQLAVSPFQSREEILLDARQKASEFVQCFQKENVVEKNAKRKEIREGRKKRSELVSQSLGSGQARNSLKLFRQLRKQDEDEEVKEGKSMRTSSLENNSNIDRK